MPTLWITGANRGLGLEFVRQYAADGWDIIACCREPDKAEALQKLAKQHSKLRIEALDVADHGSIAALAPKLKDIAIDLLINNAGIYSGAGGSLSHDSSQTFGSLDAEAWVKVLQVNTLSPILMIQALLASLKKGTGKKIVNITSRMGSLSEMGSGSLAYRTSKAALNAAMRVIMHDLQKSQLAIYNFHPGWVQTDMGGKGAHLTPEQSVSAMRQSIAGLTPDQSGQFLNYDGQTIPW